jgi:hypothetical protein
MQAANHLNSKRHLLVLMGIALLSATTLHAQTAPVAPLPAQLTMAKTAFLGNAGTIDNQYSTLAYNDFYQQLAAWNHYQLTINPANADLALEISVNVAVGDTSNGTSFATPYLHLTIRDAKTQVLLWTISENIQGAFRAKTFEKNLDAAIGKITTDLKNLVSGNSAATANQPVTPAPKALPVDKKTRFGQTSK